MKTSFQAPDHQRLEDLFQRLTREQAFSQLRKPWGTMASLATDEQGRSTLGWVEVVPALLREPDLLTQVEQEAQSIWKQGIRHIIWAGMGGAIRPVEVLCKMGFGQDSQGIRIYPLEGTDPLVALYAIARAKQVPLPTTAQEWSQLLEDVLMIAATLSPTSAEALLHLEWFCDLLKETQRDLESHVLVLARAGSRLDTFAGEQLLPTLPILLSPQHPLEGCMSAPGTRVFLLPIALHWACGTAQGFLASVLRQAWAWYDLSLAERQPEHHAFVRLACLLYQASTSGSCRLLLDLPPAWQPLFPWIEQVLEQSTGKGGKGLVVFPPQTLNEEGPGYQPDALARVRLVNHPNTRTQAGIISLFHPSFALLASDDPQERLVALAASFLGWQLTMAVYSYLADIPFGTEPAVERAKALTRQLQAVADPFEDRRAHSLVALPQESGAAASIAHVLAPMVAQGTLRYLDVSFHGPTFTILRELLERFADLLGPRLLGVPAKVRRTPEAYHLSEQCQLDGPSLLSLRLFVRHGTPADLPPAHTSFFQAQAVAAWMAMREARRSCFLLTVDASQAPVDEVLMDFFVLLLIEVAGVCARHEALLPQEEVPDVVHP